MSIAKYMTTKVITVDSDDNLAKVKSLFEQHAIHHLIVTENKQLVGVVTDCDLYRHISPTLGTSKQLPTDLSHANKKVHLIMQHNPSYAYADLSLKEAVLLFHDNKLTCLPIVDDKLRPIGIITWRDIIGLLAKQYRLKNATDNTA